MEKITKEHKNILINLLEVALDNLVADMEGANLTHDGFKAVSAQHEKMTAIYSELKGEQK
jgi:hypothetical protein